MTKKRQLSKEDKVIWNNFTTSIHHLAYKNKYCREQSYISSSVVYDEAQGKKFQILKTKISNKFSCNKHSFFIQHYKLFKMQKDINSTKNDPFYLIGKKKAGLDKNTWKKLQKGELKTQKRLDLHGFTAHHAFLALENFLLNAYHQQIRCIEVITGVGNLAQGEGILKKELPHWLNRPYIKSMILGTSYVSATNNGAVRILLKRKR